GPIKNSNKRTNTSPRFSSRRPIVGTASHTPPCSYPYGALGLTVALHTVPRHPDASFLTGPHTKCRFIVITGPLVQQYPLLPSLEDCTGPLRAAASNITTPGG
ncbi:unnamed protein product, partial [Ectocarpus sp. 12 AP-2014]